MKCSAVQNNQLKPDRGNSGSIPSCTATLSGFYVGFSIMRKVTQNKLRQILFYNKKTGIFRWLKVSKYHLQLNGKEAGTIQSSRNKKYRRINIKNISYAAHRLAWLYCFGVWPHIIDHKNGNSLDNRICNLNNVNVFQNTQNHKVKIKANGLPTGVKQTSSGKFIARIRTNHKKIHLGTYDTITSAAKAYSTAQKKLHYCPCMEVV